MAHPRILLVEDDPDIVRIIQAYLLRDGFRVEVAQDGWHGLALALAAPPDLIVLDWMLPGLDGLGFMQRLRREQRTPVIMLTARSEEADRVLGLELGADDYVTKPFSPRELVARIKAVLRRLQAAPAATLQLGGLVISPENRTVHRHGESIVLTAREFDLLQTLARQPERVFSRDELLARVWGADFAGVDRVVDVHISNLRQKLEPDPERPRWLLTVRGVGYKVSHAQP
ncbi:MAG: response regulator transcription factor [Truepera sp.]|nr:response regulator transcription factor [Truepera sp.]